MEIQRKSEIVDTSCKSNEMSENSLGDTTCFLHRPFQIPGSAGIFEDDMIISEDSQRSPKSSEEVRSLPKTSEVLGRV